MSGSRNGWFILPKKLPKPRVRLFCFPYAGGGSMIYRSWAEQLPQDVELCCVQLPGRESRISEPSFRSIPSVVEAIAAEIVPFVNEPFAFFGHSMGAMIGFELARTIKKTHEREPLALFLSARRAPQIPSDEPPTYDLPRDEFLEELKRLNGTPEEVLAHPELFQIMEPLLRADFEVCQTYTYTDGPLLSCPMTVFGGLKDEEVTREKLEAWRKHSTGHFVLRMLPGDHFFLHSSKRLLLQMLSQELLLLMRTASL